MKQSTLPVQLKILDPRIGKDFPIPEQANPGDAGVDMRACIDAPLILKPGETKLIPTGIAIYLEDPNWVALLLPRSGLGHKHGIVLGNLVGVVDSSYQGQVFVSCWNRGSEEFEIKPGDRIAQMVIMPVTAPKFTVVDEFAPSERGAGGFGSSGRS